MRKIVLFTLFVYGITAVWVVPVLGQGSAFVYQGKLHDGGNPANGQYEFQFRLFDSVSGGNQIGPTLTDVQAAVDRGIFAVDLDFGVNSFPGMSRYLEISVRLSDIALSSNNVPYTLLNPRQKVASTPYAVRSLNSSQADIAINSQNLGGIAAANYVVTTDPRMSDSRDPLPGSGNYIQNSNTVQPTSNFNISGEGKADIFSVLTQFNIGSKRVLSIAGTENVFVGPDSGNVTTGGFNSFFGSKSGNANTTGLNNSFFGAYAGTSNINGNSNSFFGGNTGLSNISGERNSFFGSAAGYGNISGNSNSLFGSSAGESNVAGANNAMFGTWAGKQTSSGGNSFFGAFSGEKNTTGSFNSYFGLRAGKDTFAGNYNVYIGYETGSGNQAGSNNTFIGSSATGTGSGQTLVGFSVSGGNGSNNTVIGNNASANNGVSNASAIGASAIADESDAIVLGSINSKVKIPGNGIWSFGSISTPSTVMAGTINSSSLTTGYASINGSLDVTSTINANTGNFLGNVTAQYVGMTSLAGGGSEQICIQPQIVNVPHRFLAACSSSRRYKENIRDFPGGLDVVRRLRPVTFRWKQGRKLDIGFVAEEVNEIEPLLNNFNESGEVEGVKYAQITTVLVNAVKEQQTQIENLRQQVEILRSVVCTKDPTLHICQSINN